MKKALDKSATVSTQKKSPAPQKKEDQTRLQKGILTAKPQVYYIKWRDAFTETDEWHDLESISDGDYICETIGYLIEKNKKNNYYSIAGTITFDGQFASIINIPKAMVISKKVIKLA